MFWNILFWILIAYLVVSIVIPSIEESLMKRNFKTAHYTLLIADGIYFKEFSKLENNQYILQVVKGISNATIFENKEDCLDMVYVLKGTFDIKAEVLTVWL